MNTKFFSISPPTYPFGNPFTFYTYAGMRVEYISVGFIAMNGIKTFKCEICQLRGGRILRGKSGARNEIDSFPSHHKLNKGKP